MKKAQKEKKLRHHEDKGKGKKRRRHHDTKGKDRLPLNGSARLIAPPVATNPPPSVAPPALPPPPSVAPPAVKLPPPPPATEKLPARRGRKSRINWTAELYLKMAHAFSGPHWRTPTVALSFLHRGHDLLDVYSPDTLRHAWNTCRASPNSPVNSDAVAAQLGYVHQCQSALYASALSKYHN